MFNYAEFYQEMAAASKWLRDKKETPLHKGAGGLAHQVGGGLQPVYLEGKAGESD